MTDKIFAKILSDVSGATRSLLDIQAKCDLDGDGALFAQAISVTVGIHVGASLGRLATHTDEDPNEVYALCLAIFSRSVETAIGRSIQSTARRN